MIARGPAARPTPPPLPFAARLSKVTGEGEQLEITIVADDAEDLARDVAAAGTIASARLKANNDAITQAAETLEARTRRVYADAVQALRRELGLRAERPERPEDEPPPPDEEPPAPEDEPAPEEEVSRADRASGALHAPAHP
jgi:hypothetical protein